MFLKVDEMYNNLLSTSKSRVKIEHQDEGWAVIIDGEVYTWCKSKDRAYDTAVRLMELDVYEY